MAVYQVRETKTVGVACSESWERPPRGGRGRREASGGSRAGEGAGAEPRGQAEPQ